MAELRRLRGGGGDAPVELRVEDERRQIRVTVEVDQLLLHVAVVDVDGDDACLHTGQHGLEVLDAVVEVQPEMLAGTDARLDEVVGDAVGRGVELRVREPAFGTCSGMVEVDERLAFRDSVDDRFEQVGKVVLHRSS